MDNQHTFENKQQTDSEAEKGSQPKGKKETARNVLENTTIETDSVRLAVDGSLLGACLLFFLTMMTMQQKQIDVPLTRALYIFVVAVPFLVCGFLFSCLKVKPVHSAETLVILKAVAQFIDAIGWFAVPVGVFFVIQHISTLASTIFLVAIGGCLLLLFIVSLIIGYCAARRAEKKRQHDQQSTTISAAPHTQQ